LRTAARAVLPFGIWVSEGGWTLFPFLANYLTTGSGGVVTNRDGWVLDRYLARSVNGVLACGLPATNGRRRSVEALRWVLDVPSAVAMVDGELHEAADPNALPPASDSADLCHSDGTLEHYRPEALAAFLSEARRIPRPGGVLSPVFDHLHHADPSWPFHGHLALRDPLYELAFGHRLPHHDRLLPIAVEAMFTEAGLEPYAG
jgi:SAM-dependent methyltransferase